MPQDPDEIIALDTQVRYELFLEAAKKEGQLWTLADGEALLVLGFEGHEEFVAVFPQADVVGEWFQTVPVDEADLVAMSTEDWLGNVLDELTEGEVEICVFPTMEDSGTFVSAAELKAALAAS